MRTMLKHSVRTGCVKYVFTHFHFQIYSSVIDQFQLKFGGKRENYSAIVTTISFELILYYYGINNLFG